MAMGRMKIRSVHGFALLLATAGLSACINSGGLVQQPSKDGSFVDPSYLGCVSADSTSPTSIRVEFEFPTKATQVNVYRDDILVKEASSRNFKYFIDTQLQTGRVYTYKCEAVVDGQGWLGRQSLTAQPTIDIQFAGLTAATNISATQIRLDWSAATGSALNALIVYRVIEGGTSLQFLKQVDKNSTTTTLSGLTPGRLYTFRVKAADADGNQEANQVNASAFTYAGIQSFNQISTTSARLTFPAGEDADRLNIYCKEGGNPYSVGATAQVTNNSSTTYTLTSLDPTKLYTCKVKALAAGFEDDNVLEIPLQMVPDDPFITGTYLGCVVSAPDSRATGPTSTQVSAVFPATATRINIYRNGSLLGSITDRNTPAYSDTGLTTGNTYNYTCEAENSIGTKLNGTNSVALTPSIDLGFAGLVSAKNLDGSRAELEWVPSTNPAVSKYLVYRVLDTQLQFLRSVDSQTLDGQGNTVSTSKTVVNGLSGGQNYVFRVRAEDNSGNKESNNVNRNTFVYEGIGAATVLNAVSARIDFAAGTDASRLNIKCKTNLDPTYVTMSQVTDMSATSSVLSGLSAGVQYTCRVNALFGLLEDFNTKEISFTPIGETDYLEFASNLVDGSAGDAFAVAPVVHIRDRDGNLVTSGPDSTVQVTLSVVNNAATLYRSNGSTNVVVNAIGGIANFASLGVKIQSVGSYRLRATKASTEGQTNGSQAMSTAEDIGNSEPDRDSNSFAIGPGAASTSQTTLVRTSDDNKLVNCSQSGDPNLPVSFRITLKDAYSNVIPNTLAGIEFSSPDPQSRDVVSADAMTNSLGEATFTVKSCLAGFRAVRIKTPAGLGTVTSSVDFLPGGIFKYSWTGEAADGFVGQPLAPTPSVVFQDNKGNPIKFGVSDLDQTAYLRIRSAPSGDAALSPSLNAQVTINRNTGVASFSGLSLNRSGTYVLFVETTGVADNVVQSPNSTSFNLQPSNTRVLRFVDNAVDNGGSPVAYSLTQKECKGPLYIENQTDAGETFPVTSTKTIKLSTVGAVGSFYSNNTCSTGVSNNEVSLPNGQGRSSAFYYQSTASSGPQTLEACDWSGGSCTALITPAMFSVTLNSLTISRVALTTQPAATLRAGYPVATQVTLYGKAGSQEVVVDVGPSATASVSLSKVSGATSSILGTNAKNAVAGVATFDTGPVGDAYFTNLGSHTIRATASGVNSDTSDAINVIPGDPYAANSTITGSTTAIPLIALNDVNNVVNVKIVIKDQWNNVVTLDNLSYPTFDTVNANGLPTTHVRNFYTQCNPSGSEQSIKYECTLKSDHAENKKLRIRTMRYLGTTTDLQKEGSQTFQFKSAGLNLEVAHELLLTPGTNINNSTTAGNANSVKRVFYFDITKFDGNPEVYLEVLADNWAASSLDTKIERCAPSALGTAPNTSYDGSNCAVVATQTVSLAANASSANFKYLRSNNIASFFTSDKKLYRFTTEDHTFFRYYAIRLIVKQTQATSTQVSIPLATRPYGIVGTPLLGSFAAASTDTLDNGNAIRWTLRDEDFDLTKSGSCSGACAEFEVVAGAENSSAFVPRLKETYLNNGVLTTNYISQSANFNTVGSTSLDVNVYSFAPKPNATYELVGPASGSGDIYRATLRLNLTNITRVRSPHMLSSVVGDQTSALIINPDIFGGHVQAPNLSNFSNAKMYLETFGYSNHTSHPKVNLFYSGSTFNWVSNLATMLSGNSLQVIWNQTGAGWSKFNFQEIYSDGSMSSAADEHNLVGASDLLTNPTKSEANAARVWKRFLVDTSVFTNDRLVKVQVSDGSGSATPKQVLTYSGLLLEAAQPE